MERFLHVDVILPVPPKTFDLALLTMKVYVVTVLVLMATLSTGRTGHKSFCIKLMLKSVLKLTVASKNLQSRFCGLTEQILSLFYF